MDEVAQARSRSLADESQDHFGGDQRERPQDQQASRASQRALGRLPTFFTIGKQEKANVLRSLKSHLSGYLGGISRGGYWCTRLSDEWCSTFSCRYAVPCNSATSGLLAACMAADICEGDLVWVSTYTMSASATCAILLGAEVKFMDIDPDYFCMQTVVHKPWPKAIIVTNLFGHPAHLHGLRLFCDERKITLIEDNAQAPFAMDGGAYTGTIGHMGVFSLNVHKHLQSGEGGVIVTNDASLAHKLDCAINHGELMRTNPQLGLNLRMTEPIAAIASAQLKRGSHIVQGRINLAHRITSMFEGIPFVETPRVREGCVHVYYLWAGKITNGKRKPFLEALQRRGVPFRSGYSPLLHRLLGDGEDSGELFPVATSMEEDRLFTFEICAYDPNSHHLKLMKQIIQQEVEKIYNESDKR